jgi:hypothetical protein
LGVLRTPRVTLGDRVDRDLPFGPWHRPDSGGVVPSLRDARSVHPPHASPAKEKRRDV